MSNPIKVIKSGFGAVQTIDSFRAAIVDGNAFTVGFSDVTGITAATSYYYIVKNASTTKNAWVRSIDFASCNATSGSVGSYLDALQILVIKDGIFALAGTPIDINDYTTSAYDAYKMPALNLNGNSDITSEMGVWSFSSIAAALGQAITWTDTDTNKILKRVASDAIKPSVLQEKMRIVPPGTILMAILTNFTATKAAYKINVEWAEI